MVYNPNYTPIIAEFNRKHDDNPWDFGWIPILYILKSQFVGENMFNSQFCYQLVNIQIAIEHGHWNSGFTY
jgi:hypothetical protein